MGIENKKISQTEECGEISELLSSYIDEQLNEEDHKKVKRHLESCISCKTEYEEVKHIRQLLNDVEEQPVPVEFDLRLKEALLKERKTRRPVWRQKAFGAMAAAVLIILFSYNYFNNALFPFEKEESSMTMMKSADVDNQTEDGTLASPNPGSGAARSSDSVQSVQEADAESSIQMYDETFSIDYMQIINDKLSDYDYEIISDFPEKSEIVLLILHDKDGNAINREFIINYSDDQIRSPDNWLDIDFN